MTSFRGLTPLGSTKPAAPRLDRTIDEQRRTLALAVIAAGRLARGETLTDAERAALDAVAGEAPLSPLDAQRKAFADQVILAGKMRRNEA